MIAKANARHVRISPRKLREVVNLIRGKSTLQSLAILSNVSRKANEPLIKLVNSALANAKVKGMRPEQLFISRIVVGEGPTWKRFRAASFGRAVRIRKKTSHINLELDLIK